MVKITVKLYPLRVLNIPQSANLTDVIGIINKYGMAEKVYPDIIMDVRTNILYMYCFTAEDALSLIDLCEGEKICGQEIIVERCYKHNPPSPLIGLFDLRIKGLY
uniref:RRM domain-containing protein n=1 Tax=Cuerna arida TaxID=1464854 RepID=A0A1B6GS49_9HEMI